MKSKEEIYNALKIHVDDNTTCLECPYNKLEDDSLDCLDTLHKDILASFYGEFHNE